MRLITQTSLVEDYDHVYSSDPAIDSSVDDFEDRWERYLDTGDAAHLPVKAGQTPAVWRLRHLRGLAKRRIMRLYAEAQTRSELPVEVLYEACKLALVGTVGVKDETGKEAELPRVHVTQLGIDALTESSMAALDSVDSGALVNEIGLRALRSVVAPPK